MARRRMFSKDVVESDRFLDMPFSAQALYFHLGMMADDDGFVTSPRSVARSINARNEDLMTLVSAGYIVAFDSGVIVITDWHANNLIRSDRYTPTIHINEKNFYESKKEAWLTGGIPVDNQAGDTRPVLPARLTTGIPVDNQPAPPGLGLGIGKGIKEQERDTLSSSESTGETDAATSEIVAYLNTKTGASYRASTRKTRDLVKARMREGFGTDDFKRVIDVKSAEWGNDPKMAKYLRPETLFGPKFEGYLNQRDGYAGCAVPDDFNVDAFLETREAALHADAR